MGLGAEIWAVLGALVIGALAWLVRMIRRADRDRRDLKDAREYQATMERMTNAPLVSDPDDARRRMRERAAKR